MGNLLPGGRFNNWPTGITPYNYTELANDWSNLNDILGYRSDNVQWPVNQGANQGLYQLTNFMQQDRLPIGAILPWFSPNPSVATPSQSSGWRICDGSTVLAADHDFNFGSQFVLPDMRNCYVMGADYSQPFGQTQHIGSSDLSTIAPGMVKGPTSPGQKNQGEFGSNLKTITPAHFHTHNHIHEVGPGPSGNYEIYDGTSEPGFFISSSIPSPGSLSLSRAQHRHHIDFFSSAPRVIDSANQNSSGPSDPSKQNLTQSTTQQIQTGGTPTAPTSSQGVGADLAMDVRPRTVGLLWIMKVKYADTVLEPARP